MGFPVPYAGVFPKLLFTAAMSIAALRDLCSSLLHLVGLSSYATSHGHLLHLFNSHAFFNQDPADLPSSPLDPSALAQFHEHHAWYFNSHLHMPSDRRLLLRRSAFSEAVQASLPVLRYGSLQVRRASSCSPLPSACLQSSMSAPLSSSLANSQVQMEGQNAAALHPTLSMVCTSSSASSLGPLSTSYLLPSRSVSFASSSLSSPPSSSSLGSLQELTMKATLPFSEQHEVASSCTTAECAVCLCEFQRDQEVRELPLCNHVFHKDCIDGWILHNHRTCPLCRESILTPTMALQEMLQEQERLSQQLTASFTHNQEEEETYFTHHHHQHQSFFFTMHQPTGY